MNDYLADCVNEKPSDLSVNERNVIYEALKNCIDSHGKRIELVADTLNLYF